MLSNSSKNSSTTTQTIIFDFDGTLADTLDIIIEIYNNLAPDFGARKIDPKDIYELRKRGSSELFQSYGVHWIKLPFLVSRVKQELKAELKNVKTFAGIPEMLQDLKENGYNLGILSSNSVENIEFFLNQNNLSQYFDFIYSGRNLFGKDKVLGKIVKQQKLNKEKVVYVGDETRDIEACRKFGIPIISVAWGFQDSKTLEEINPGKVLNHPKDFLKMLSK